MQEAEERALSVLICQALKNFEALGLPTSRTPNDWTVHPIQTITSNEARSSTSNTKSFPPVISSGSPSEEAHGDSKWAAAWKIKWCAWMDRVEKERDRHLEEGNAKNKVDGVQKDVKQNWSEKEYAHIERRNR
jgi:hypothetical protein